LVGRRGREGPAGAKVEKSAFDPPTISIERPIPRSNIFIENLSTKRTHKQFVLFIPITQINKSLFHLFERGLFQTVRREHLGVRQN